MARIQTRTGTLLRATVANGETVDAPDFCPPGGASSIVYFVLADGAVVADVFRVNKEDEETSQTRGAGVPVTANIEEAIAFNYRLHRSRLRITNNSGGSVDVLVDVDYGGKA